MRRLISTCLLLFFCLGPLSAAFQTNEDARLPACCRRHGAHHCNMSGSDAARIAATSDTPVLLASPHCAQFPRTSFAVNAAPHAFLTTAASLARLLANEHSPAAASAFAKISQLRTRADRGPPDSRLA